MWYFKTSIFPVTILIGAKLSCQYENKVVENAIIDFKHKIKEIWTCET